MKNLFLTNLVLLATVVQLFAQENTSQLFRAFQNKSENSILPDFSYAGYHCGEKEIPTITDYKVFDVTAFGAIPNDTLSDKVAIQKAIDAANQNGSGIVFFPKGRFLVNEKDDLPNSIVSKSSNIIFRGSGSGENGTELFMGNTLQPGDPTKILGAACS
jgi:polygalacturonase